MNKVNIFINGNKIRVDEGITILQAAEKLNIAIPTLCHMYLQDGKTENCRGTCRVCVVEVTGRKTLAPACSTPVFEGMEIKTNTPRVINSRRNIVGLLLSDHPHDCLKCEKNLKCELQNLAAQLGVKEIKYEGEKRNCNTDLSCSAIVKDMDKCILCKRCVTVCNKIQNVSVLTPGGRGFNTEVTTFFSKPLGKTDCTQCGQCIAVCPTGALREKFEYDLVWEALEDSSKYVVVQAAPAVRVALGEEFGMEPGERTTKRMVGALRALGFKKVFDTNFAADLTIMEEATEFIERVKANKDLPLITSCCPAWVRFAETRYGDSLNHLSSCKSPQQMFGAIAKTYLAEKLGIESENLVVVSVMPCVAKKAENKREEFENNGVKDVDYVITTRELAKMIKEAGMDLGASPKDDFDDPLGESTGAGDLFGTTGGVMEAALRTAYEWITGEELNDIDFMEVRGLEGIKEATIKLPIGDVKVAVVSSLGNASKIMEEVERGESPYAFIEVMACPGGCIDGGGQPFIKANRKILEQRLKAIYSEDSSKDIRKSHENPAIKKLYNEFLDKPGSYMAHELLHTEYKKR